MDEHFESLRVSVAVQIVHAISDRSMTQAEAAKLFGVPQPTISEITRLRLGKLSLALLLKMLFKAELPFTITHSGTPELVSARVDTAFTAEKRIRPEWKWREPTLPTQSQQTVQLFGSPSH